MGSEDEQKGFVPSPEQDAHPDRLYEVPGGDAVSSDNSATAWEHFIDQQNAGIEQSTQTVADTQAKLTEVRQGMGLPESDEVPPSIAVEQDRIAGMTANRDAVRDQVRQSAEGLKLDHDLVQDREDAAQEKKMDKLGTVAQAVASVGLGLVRVIFNENDSKYDKPGEKGEPPAGMRGRIKDFAEGASGMWKVLDTVGGYLDNRGYEARVRELQVKIDGAKDDAERARHATILRSFQDRHSQQQADAQKRTGTVDLLRGVLLSKT
ncbi:MAG: hypothetical protein V1916_01095 [Patescibacteria group bacterium]